MWRKVWIWERKRKEGKTYCVRWLDDRGRTRTEGVGPDRRLAERIRTQKESDLNSGKVEAIDRVGFDAYMSEELEIMKGRVSPSTIKGLDLTLGHFRRICEPGCVADIKPKTVEAFLSQRLKEVRLATANKDLRTLKASLSRGVKRGYLLKNPAADVKSVREPEKEIRVLSTEEVGKLFDACPSLRWRAFIGLAVTTGMRRGELLALRWEDVDMEAGSVWVRNTESHLTKSRRNRLLGLVPEAGALLKQLPRRGELIFQTAGGESMANNVQRDFMAIVRRSGIKRCTLHDLRRTFVSQLAMAGVSAGVTQKLAGHASISTTVKHYTGVMPEALREAQGRLPFGAILSGVSKLDRGPKSQEDGQRAEIIRFPLATG